MDIAVPSRFACLKIEDDDFRPGGSSSRRNKEGKRPGSSKKDVSKVLSAGKKKVGGNNEKSKKNKKTKDELERNWEEWQKKDDKFVDEDFEQQMTSAILQSKLEFEQQKKSGSSKSDPDQANQKKKKNKTMSLNQFLENDKEVSLKETPKMTKEEEKDFFQEAFESAKKVVIKDKVEQNRKKRQEEFEEIVSLAQCQEKLEAEKQKNTILQKELEEARKEIALVKKRNSTLCSMLSQGEMKDKVEVLRELERLTLVKEELTEEVTKLHKKLEQERSSKGAVSNDVHAKHNSNNNNKDKAKKKKH